MRTLRSLFAGALGVLSVSAQLAAGSVFVVGCYDDDLLSPAQTTTLTASGGGGQGGSLDTSPTTSMGGNSTTAVGGSTTTAMGGAGGASTGGASTGGATTGGDGGAGGAIAQMAPDFSLVDLNSASPSSGQTVSPRDYLGRVSAWYFGHST